MASSYLVGWIHGAPTGLVSVGVGLWGVALARWVFINRENRRLPRPQNWRETLPLTLVAMLIAAVIIHDRQLGLSAAAFTGLGVGWSVILLLDIFGERIQAMLRAGWAAPVKREVQEHADLSGHAGKVLDSDVETTPEICAAMDKLDRIPGPRDTPEKT